MRLAEKFPGQRCFEDESGERGEKIFARAFGTVPGASGRGTSRRRSVSLRSSTARGS